MRTKQRSSQCRVLRASLLLTLTTIILFSCSQQSLAQQWSTNGNDISNTNTGNVGVGTTGPGSKLDVNGRIQQTGSATDAGYLLTNGGLLANTTALNPGIAFYGGNGVNALYGADLGFNSSTGRYRTRLFSGNQLADVALGWQQNVQANPTQSAFIEFLTVRGDTGNVGIGTANPAKKLHVFSSNSQVMIDRAANTAGNYALVNFATNRVDKFLIGMNADSDPGVDKLSFFEVAFSSVAPVMTITGGRLGIGTTAPAHKLDVVGEIRASGGFRFADGTLQTTAAGGGGSQWTNSGTSIFYNSGNVGIGTASPTEKLEVIGNIKVSGNINAKYQDVAEWVDSSQELVAGTVVVLDSSRSNHVIAATQSYDSRIAGVISLQPGLTLGEEAEGRVLVATTGRILVNVDATSGPIQIGDLLVTSDREGFAMKSLPLEIGGARIHRPGTLIGKALEPLASGTGKILVLLSLQ